MANRAALLLLLALLSGAESKPATDDVAAVWAAAALAWWHSLACDDGACGETARLNASTVRVYAAVSSNASDKLIVRFVDAADQLHEGVVAIEPLSQRHERPLFYVFFVNRVRQNECSGGRFVESLSSCLRSAAQSTVGNRLPTATLYLPVVVKNVTVRSKQLLRCRRVAQFAACAPSSNLRMSWKRNSVKKLHVRCRLFETCDHALILQTDWRPPTWRDGDAAATAVERSLVSAGYLKENIRLFSTTSEPRNSHASERWHSAANKKLLRNYVRYLCSRRRCIATVTVFVRAVGTQDGDILLWDTNNNGLAEDDERYSVSEILADLDSCSARRLLFVLDLPGSDKLAAALRSKLATQLDVKVITESSQRAASSNARDDWSGAVSWSRRALPTAPSSAGCRNVPTLTWLRGGVGQPSRASAVGSNRSRPPLA